MNEFVYFYPEGHEKHTAPQHPERPERITAMVQGLEEAGLWKGYPRLSPIELSPAFLHLVHTPAHLRLVERMSRAETPLDGDTFLTRSTWQLALNAAGGAAALALAVWDRKAASGFALTRPPGHHATPDRAMGFCLLNNVAIAAQALITLTGARKVAIVDLDLHHGNGTQDIFYNRGDVFFVSTHQSPLYPGTGGLYETGSGAGAGSTLNLPFPPYSGDQAFLVGMDEVILPLLERARPEMILVSFGVDPHWRDPLGNLLLSAEVYGRLIASLKTFAAAHCHGRIALFLEGGYDLLGASSCAVAGVSALLDRPFNDPVGPSPLKESGAWADVIHKARLHWGL